MGPAGPGLSLSWALIDALGERAQKEEGARRSWLPPRWADQNSSLNRLGTESITRAIRCAGKAP